MQRFLAVSGRSTPAAADYSMEQALVERGDLEAALSLYEARFAASPDDTEAMLRAADLYARSAGNPQRAVELFNALRRVDGVTPQQDLYATNRLIDLYTGPLATPARALAELRRLIDRVSQQHRRHTGACNACSVESRASRSRRGWRCGRGGTLGSSATRIGATPGQIPPTVSGVDGTKNLESVR